MGATRIGLANSSLELGSPPETNTRGFFVAGASGSAPEPLVPCFSVVGFVSSPCRGDLTFVDLDPKAIKSPVGWCPAVDFFFSPPAQLIQWLRRGLKYVLPLAGLLGCPGLFTPLILQIATVPNWCATCGGRAEFQIFWASFIRTNRTHNTSIAETDLQYVCAVRPND